ncbi:hypothetical protein T11_2151 [Trichinella zimbabwensis]|uniref:Uncharacterized protein n=1 Tax=Trichinella zimbabwensis TaxID=268475 RepID=A0A0V1GBE2_9BILA|nr:hypothetical protein T11_2151 [Trichinella zimbabwensis]
MIIATEIVKCVIYHSTKFYNECRILGFVVVDGYVSGYAACQLILTCQLSQLHTMGDISTRSNSMPCNDFKKLL